MSVKESLHVVAGVIEDADGRVLLARRMAGTHLAGKWEFPGGKLEAGEGPFQALRRELGEELGIQVEAAEPLICVPHRYPERLIYLDVWRVLDYDGLARGVEGQQTHWFTRSELAGLDLPAADWPVVRALQLPDRYLITPDCQPGGQTHFLRALRQSLERGIRLLQLRVFSLPESEWSELAESVAALVHRYGGRLLVNGNRHWDPGGPFDGVHLNGRDLVAGHRPCPQDGALIAASCHDAKELKAAEALGVDFCVLSTIRPTASHPYLVDHLGWSGFARLVAQTPLPTYALGGVGEQDLKQARQAGAQGVAGISQLWGA